MKCWDQMPWSSLSECWALSQLFHFPLSLLSIGFFGKCPGTPLRYSCLETAMDGGAWWAAVHGVARSRTRPRDFTFTFHFHELEKEMATHSSVLAWRIPGTAEPSGLPSMGSHRVDWSDLAARGFFSSSSLSAIKVVSSAYLRLLIFLPAILIPACASSSPAFLMMHSAYKLNKQGDDIQPWCTPFPIWNQSVVPCPLLTVASWPAYRFLKRQIKWSGK